MKNISEVIYENQYFVINLLNIDLFNKIYFFFYIIYLINIIKVRIPKLIVIIDINIKIFISSWC